MFIECCDYFMILYEWCVLCSSYLVFVSIGGLQKKYQNLKQNNTSNCRKKKEVGAVTFVCEVESS